MSDEQSTRGRASLGRALKHGFRAAYDSMGYVVGASFATFAITGVVLALMGLLSAHVKQLHAFGMLLGLAATPVSWLCAVGLSYYAWKTISHQRPTPSDTFKGIRGLFWPAIALFAVDLVISTVLFGDAVFFALAFRAKGGAIAAGLAMVCAYLALMWSLMCVWHLPLLVAQLEMESGPRVWVILRKSFLLTADNPGFTVGLFVVIIAFAVLCVISAFGMALVFAGTLAFLLTCSLRELFIKYGIVEEEPEVVEDRPWRLPDGN